MAKKRLRSKAADTGSNGGNSAVDSPAQSKTRGRVNRRAVSGYDEALTAGQTEPSVPTQDAGHSAPGGTRLEGTPDPSESTPAEPSEDQIRVRAYLRYLERGAGHGADFDDWLQAEMELKKR